MHFLCVLILLTSLYSCAAPDLDDSEIKNLNTTLFPMNPSQMLTPGVRCQKPDSYRYPSQIGYCKRRVSLETKNQVIEEYDAKLDYKIASLPRINFKIDHFIPLCMGGDNDIKNLWPQHCTVFTLTDQIEEKLCELLSLGSITQDEAISKIIEVKTHLENAPDLILSLEKQL